jgi:hypothetical protein
MTYEKLEISPVFLVLLFWNKVKLKKSSQSLFKNKCKKLYFEKRFIKIEFFIFAKDETIIKKFDHFYLW